METQTGTLTYEGTEAHVDLGDIGIHYHEAGQDHDRTVVFLHGGGPGASGWSNFCLNIEPFAGHFRTILLDLPNYGRSDSHPVAGIDGARFNAGVVSRFLEAKGIERASLMGNSMGGMAAISFSVHHTDQLDANVLMGTSTGPSLFDPAPMHGVTVLLEMFADPSRELVEKMVRLMVFDDSFVDDTVIDQRWAAVQDAIERGHLAAMRQGRPVWTDESPNLAGVPNPTLVLYGAHDRFAAMDNSIGLMRRYPNSELHVFRNCGHWVQFERADDFNALVIDWLLRQIGRSTASLPPTKKGSS